MNVYETIKENSSDINNIREGFQKLLKDEQEAILGYKQVLASLYLHLPDEALHLVEDKFNHIIEEEKEHMNELEDLFKQIKPLI